ncbi:MAG: D-aminoacylase [Planctomycetes bacterium]|nr:D-aminoacylase [Planctomycetota bacterium]
MPNPDRAPHRRMRFAAVSLALWIVASLGAHRAVAQHAAATLPKADLLLAGGLVIDGTGAPPRRADVAIRGDRIVAIGDALAVEVARTVDCAGRVVAPGFIDVHTHADTVAARRGDARNFVAMGVTTIVTGNCGTSVDDLAAHFAAVERHCIAVNYGSLVGHGTVRSAVLGSANRAPNADELARMRALVRAGLDAGAFGLSTGLIYVPGTFAETDEIVALCEEVAAVDGVYATHMRDEGDRVLQSIDEALEIGRRAGCRVHLSHLKASGRPNWGRSEQIADRLAAARAAGQPVTGDQYAYTASSTSLDVLFPSEVLAEGRRAFAQHLADDAAFRAAMSTALLRTMERSGFGDLSYAQIATAPRHAELQGLRLPAAARALFDADDGDAQARTAIELMVAARGARVAMIYHKMDDADVERLLALPYLGIASDAGIRDYDLADKPHPRGAGNNPRVLGRYVRERGVLSLELAIRKMTALPAEIFDLRDRGVLRAGAFADVVVFDAERIADRATYEDPLAEPVGIDHVLVNGCFVVEAGAHSDARPGRVLRRAAPTERGSR